MKTLREKQVDDLAYLIQNPRTALLHDPAVGKTPPVCTYMYWNWVRQNERSVWIQPKSIMEKNREELFEFTPFASDDVALVDGPPKKRQEVYASDAKVFIMGADMYAKEWPVLLDAHPDVSLLSADEIHMYFSTASSKRTQAFFQSMRYIPRFVAMTGTLVAGRLNSAYPTLHVIAPHAFPSHQQFLNLYAVTDPYYGTIIGWKNHDMLKQAIEQYTRRRTFAEEYGPEAKVIVVEDVNMAPKQFEAYKKFEKEALLELTDEFLDGGMPGVFAIRCRQIMQSPQTFDITGDEYTGKDEQLRIHLADHQNTSKPLVIFGVFKDELERIVKLVGSYGMSVAMMNGDTPQAKRGEIDRDFRNGKIQVLVCSSAVAGVGFNWAHVDHMIYTALDYKDDVFLQSYRRAIRGVRTSPLLITILKYRKSEVEDRVFNIVKRKSTDANLVDNSREVFSLAS